jgi:hypothetical protein
VLFPTNVPDHQVAISDPPFSIRAPIATLVDPFVRRVRVRFIEINAVDVNLQCIG